MVSNIIPFPNKLAQNCKKQGKSFAQLLTRFDQPGPRYTSYPSIDQCSESITASDYAQALQARALGGLQRPLSLYVHIPFCESICYYCACNKVITRKRDKVNSYLKALQAEVNWVGKRCQGLTPVLQFHIGGGTPTFLSDSELLDVLHQLEAVFKFDENAERSIEIDPRTIGSSRLKNIRSMGFNRISFGVQDFNPQVQQAVHRQQSYQMVAQLMQTAKGLEFASINIDLIYGLPFQTVASFQKTIDQIIQLNPDRVALYGYAHLPARFKPQRRIQSDALPDSPTRVAILARAIEKMQQAGYEYIGMDHFAKATDSLAKARRQGLLHRNFQGYTTLPEADLIGLGVSAISRVGPCFVQNTRDLDEYLYLANNKGSAVFRGHISNRDDLIRQSVIMAILCQGALEFSDFEQTYWVCFKDYFSRELIQLQQFEQEGLLNITQSHLSLTERGWFFVRPIAMTFDCYLHRSLIDRSKVF